MGIVDDASSLGEVLTVVHADNEIAITARNIRMLFIMVPEKVRGYAFIQRFIAKDASH